MCDQPHHQCFRLANQTPAVRDSEHVIHHLEPSVLEVVEITFIPALLFLPDIHAGLIAAGFIDLFKLKLSPKVLGMDQKCYKAHI